eukprot:9042148-Pyramimonas_sp.AAC.1
MGVTPAQLSPRSWALGRPSRRGLGRHAHPVETSRLPGGLPSARASSRDLAVPRRLPIARLSPF